MNLHIEIQFTATAFRDWCTKHTTPVLHHEVHFFRRNLFCSNDKVPLIFTVFIINHDYEFSLPKVLKSLLYTIQFKFHI